MQKEAYLLELTRYIVLNPLRAGMVTSLDDWPWSSFPLAIGASPPPDWFDPDVLLRQFASERGAERSTERSAAIHAYREFVMAGKGLPSPMLDLRHQLLRGDDAVVELHKVALSGAPLREVSKAQRRAVAMTLPQYQLRHADRDEADGSRLSVRGLHHGDDRRALWRAQHDGESRGAQAGKRCCAIG